MPKQATLPVDTTDHLWACMELWRIVPYPLPYSVGWEIAWEPMTVGDPARGVLQALNSSMMGNHPRGFRTARAAMQAAVDALAPYVIHGGNEQNTPR